MVQWLARRTRDQVASGSSLHSGATVQHVTSLRKVFVCNQTVSPSWVDKFVPVSAGVNILCAATDALSD
jgi:hypothetical protein